MMDSISCYEISKCPVLPPQFDWMFFVLRPNCNSACALKLQNVLNTSDLFLRRYIQVKFGLIIHKMYTISIAI